MRLNYFVSKIILFTLLFLAINVLAPVTIMAENGWATVDTRILLMLHPQMKNFDYSNGRFFRDQSGEININKVIKELKTIGEKTEKESQGIKNEQKQLLIKRFSLVQQKTRAQGSLAPGDLEKLKRDQMLLESALIELNRQKPTNRESERLFAARKVDLKQRIATLKDKVSGQTDQSKSHELEEKIQQQIDAIDKQLNELVAEIKKIEERNVSALYLTTQETETRLAKIKKEISDLIKKAADASKIGVVMDTSFAMRSPQRKDKMKMIPAVDESPDVVSSSLFHSFDNLTINPALKAALTGPDGEKIPPEHLVVGRSLGMQSNLTQYLEFRHYMPEKVADFSNGRLFISGGTDLTPWVARQLFDRYKIPDQIKTSFMLAIRNYLNFSKQPTVRERDY